MLITAILHVWQVLRRRRPVWPKPKNVVLLETGSKALRIICIGLLQLLQMGIDIVKRWKSLMDHICNKHNDCYHDPLDMQEERRKKWIISGSYIK